MGCPLANGKPHAVACIPARKPRQRYKNMRVVLAHAASARQGFLGRGINACCPGLIAQKAVYGVAKRIQCGKRFTARMAEETCINILPGFVRSPAKRRHGLGGGAGCPGSFTRAMPLLP